jgi:hypothetical protein
MRGEPLAILWCGDEVRLRGPGRELARQLEAPDDPAAAIAGLVAEEFPTSRSVRIAYHPEALGETAVPGLARAIADSGRQVEGAWPLLALVEPALAAAAPRRSSFAPSRRTLGLGLALLLALGALGAIAIARHRRTEALRQAEREREVRALGREAAAAALSAEARRERLRRALARVEVPPQYHSALLDALARAAPTTIALRELRCEGGGFLLRGHVYEGAGRPDSPLPAFRQDLAAIGAPWRLSDDTRGEAADFTWRGVFSTGIPAPARADGPKPALLPDTASALSTLEDQLLDARARLPSAQAFEHGLAEGCGFWTVLTRSAERFPDLEIRHYALARVRPPLGAWSEIVATIRLLCAQPGLSVDSLVLAAAPDGSDAFAQAQVTLTARLRP